MFEKASRTKLRFATSRGRILTEDLWDLPLPELDQIAIVLHGQIKTDEPVSFIRETVAEDEAPKLAFDIAKHIIDVRLAEIEEARNQDAKKAKKQQLLSILARKKNDGLEELSEEEIEKMIAEL